MRINIPTEIPHVTMEELYDAYMDCRKRKRHTHNAAEFEVNEYRNLSKLLKDLNNGTYQIGKSIAFVVDYPVVREVFAADFRDRIVHHLVINRIMDAFEKVMITNSFSCRVGKGVMAAANALNESVTQLSENGTKDVWILKCDIRSFFMSIDKSLAYEKMEKLIKENVLLDDPDQQQFTLDLVKQIIMHRPEINCTLKQAKSKWDRVPAGKSLIGSDGTKGIPIGNITSQIFANFYLCDFDKYVRDELGFGDAYGRYVDDFYILSTNKECLRKTIPLLSEYLKRSLVTLHPNKVYLQPFRHGVKFVGTVILPHRQYTSNRTIYNFHRHLRSAQRWYQMHDGHLTCHERQYITSSTNSYLGFIKHTHSYNIRKRLMKELFSYEVSRYFYANSQLLKLIPWKEYRSSGKGISARQFAWHPENCPVYLGQYPTIIMDNNYNLVNTK